MPDEQPQPPDAHLACIEVVEVVTEYLEGELPPAEAKRLEEHLTTCPGCIEYVEQMRTLDGSLGDLRESAIPAGMRDDLLAAFRDFRES